MLPVQNRVRSADDFRRAFRSGVRAGSRVLVLHAAKDCESHAVRVGFVVSKAVGNAVVRNRVKRRLRALMHARLAELAPGLYVVRALPAAAQADSQALEAALARALQDVQRKLDRGR